METQENMSAEESRRIALVVQQGSLSGAGIKNLRELGYKVESCQTGITEYDYTISWA